jgi:predicted HTH transcriptional regulator
MGAPIQISVYDDKLIVWNEGSLPDNMTVEDLKKKHSSRPHNPILAIAFFKGGISVSIERLFIADPSGNWMGKTCCNKNI